MRNPIRQVFARKFFDPENLSEPLDVNSYKPYIDISPEYRILIIGTFDMGRKMSELLRGRIRSIYPNVIYLMKHQLLYVLIESHHKASDEIQEQKIAQVIGTYKLHAGISERFSSFKDRAQYIEQAESALRAGTWTAPEKIVYPYKDHYSSIMLMAAVTSMARENLIPDELVALLRCVVANPQTLNGTDTVQGLFSREDDNNQRRVDLFRFAGTLFGVRGLEARQDYLYVGVDGKLYDDLQGVH